jgi:enoyl-CoA hydratase
LTGIRCEVADETLVVTIDRPEKRNALTVAMRDELCDIFAAVDARDDVRVVLLTGADPAFSAGVDITELAAAAAPSSPSARMSSASTRPTNPAAALRAVHTPTIAAINGVCVTGALEIALSADVLIASERASFADTHAQRGLVPAWGMSALLPRAVGPVRARDLALTGRFVDAAEALAIGLVSRVVPHDELLPTALAIAARVKGADGRAVRTALDLLDASTDGPFADAIAAEQRAVATWRATRPRG